MLGGDSGFAANAFYISYHGDLVGMMVSRYKCGDD